MWLVDLKHKPLEDKGVMDIVGHQELSTGKVDVMKI